MAPRGRPSKPPDDPPKKRGRKPLPPGEAAERKKIRDRLRRERYFVLSIRGPSMDLTHSDPNWNEKASKGMAQYRGRVAEEGGEVQKEYRARQLEYTRAYNARQKDKGNEQDSGNEQDRDDEFEPTRRSARRSARQPTPLAPATLGPSRSRNQSARPRATSRQEAAYLYGVPIYSYPVPVVPTLALPPPLPNLPRRRKRRDLTATTEDDFAAYNEEQESSPSPPQRPRQRGRQPLFLADPEQASLSPHRSLANIATGNSDEELSNAADDTILQSMEEELEAQHEQEVLLEMEEEEEHERQFTEIFYHHRRRLERHRWGMWLMEEAEQQACAEESEDEWQQTVVEQEEDREAYWQYFDEDQEDAL
ncbi:hypothetical protein C8F01DRAFT_1078899 [Mycena amicta]|nr:hypothetical protein C8F01DRAFT_1078899 [Mycena amicta]